MRRFTDRRWWCEGVSLFWSPLHTSQITPCPQQQERRVGGSADLHTLIHTHTHTLCFHGLPTHSSESRKALVVTTVWTLFWTGGLSMFDCSAAGKPAGYSAPAPTPPTQPPRLCVSFRFSYEVMWRQLICRLLISLSGDFSF